ncbi:hypothetical protein J2X72_004952 [Phyllobacterium sp. 1468]|uniref:DUF6065 family protein n=1 Tax=Phyllobacterium sp. 1468 TaxID=2817759 RepID=UPI00285EE4A6|nr:DUF6065 family protein [Phyllobacterium sp. 1468]MDR6636138.1 hypothetical protein [Phyllobacterium sp. 1468]
MKTDQVDHDTELTAYQVVANAPTIRPATTRRSWMTGTYEHFAYLCLPVVAANVSGWELLCPVEFSASWDGGTGRDSLRIDMQSPNPWAPLSHFGHGILTFDTGYVFRTSPGHNLWVKGPINEAKDGLSPLEGLIETDWLPYTFTMNYRFTRPGHMVRFEKDEPFCLIHPMPSNYLNRVEPALRLLNQNEELDVQHHDWARARKSWNVERLVPGTPAASARWRRDYLRGQTATGEKAPRHEGALPLRPFEDKRP